MAEEKLNDIDDPELGKKGKKGKAGKGVKGEKVPKAPKEKLTKEEKAQQKADFKEYEQNKSEKAKKRIEYAYKSNDMYSFVRNHNRIWKLRNVIILVVVACTAFYSAILLVYWFDAGGGAPVVVPEHEHVYDYTVVEYHEGNCQEYGYSIYYCEVEFCDTFEKVLDEEIGNHRYEKDPEMQTIDGITYFIYECEICGATNTLTTLMD